MALLAHFEELSFRDSFRKTVASYADDAIASIMEEKSRNVQGEMVALRTQRIQNAQNSKPFLNFIQRIIVDNIFIFSLNNLKAGFIRLGMEFKPYKTDGRLSRINYKLVFTQISNLIKNLSSWDNSSLIDDSMLADLSIEDRTMVQTAIDTLEYSNSNSLIDEQTIFYEDLDSESDYLRIWRSWVILLYFDLPLLYFSEFFSNVSYTMPTDLDSSVNTITGGGAQQ